MFFRFGLVFSFFHHWGGGLVLLVKIDGFTAWLALASKPSVRSLAYMTFHPGDWSRLSPECCLPRLSVVPPGTTPCPVACHYTMDDCPDRTSPRVSACPAQARSARRTSSSEWSRGTGSAATRWEAGIRGAIQGRSRAEAKSWQEALENEA